MSLQDVQGYAQSLVTLSETQAKPRPPANPEPVRIPTGRPQRPDGPR